MQEEALTPAERVVAKLRCDVAPCGVAAAFDRETTPNGLDGVRWRFVAGDGERVVRIEAGVSGTNGGTRGMAVDPVALERMVESKAGSYPRESRLTDMVAASPIVLDGFDG